MTIRHMLPLFAASVLLSACAGATTFKQLSPRIPSLQLTQSRVYFYRTATRDAELQPAISLNGDPVGVAQPSSFFFVDREPGSYQVAVGDMVEQKLQINLEAGRTHYVRFDLRVGLLSDYAVPVEIPEIDGDQEILPTDYTGPPLPKRPRIPRQTR